MFGCARDGSSWRESSCVSLLPPRAASHVWTYDFVFDACANGQQIKCLSMLGVGDAVRVVRMRQTHRHVAERVVYLAARRHHPRVA